MIFIRNVSPYYGTKASANGVISWLKNSCIGSVFITSSTASRDSQFQTDQAAQADWSAA